MLPAQFDDDKNVLIIILSLSLFLMFKEDFCIPFSDIILSID